MDRKNNTGSLFESKSANPNAPAWTGIIKVDNIEYKIAGWEKLSKTNKKYISLAISEMVATQPSSKDYADLDDDIPF